MAWIESHQALSKHRKTLALSAALKTDRHKILGHLHELWWWGIDNADVDGLIGPAAPEIIAEASGWPLKQARQWVTGLVQAGFMDDTPQGFVLHDWYDYAGKLNQRRDANRERMQRARAEHVPPTDPGTNGTRADSVQRTNSARAPATVPNRTGPDRTGPNQPEEDAPSGGTPQPLAIENREPVPKPKRAPSPVGGLIDKIKTLDPDLVVYGDHGFTGTRLKLNPDADMDLVAEAYVSFRHGHWPGSGLLRESGQLAWAIADVGGYVIWRDQQAKASPGVAAAVDSVDRCPCGNTNFIPADGETCHRCRAHGLLTAENVEAARSQRPRPIRQIA